MVCSRRLLSLTDVHSPLYFRFVVNTNILKVSLFEDTEAHSPVHRSATPPFPFLRICRGKRTPIDLNSQVSPRNFCCKHN